MGFKDKKKKEKEVPEKKEQEKQPTKPKTEKKEKEQEETKKEVVSTAEKKETEKEQRNPDYSYIGISGVHPEINRFKAVCKFNGWKVGECLLEMVKQFNEQNKI